MGGQTGGAGAGAELSREELQLSVRKLKRRLRDLQARYAGASPHTSMRRTHMRRTLMRHTHMRRTLMRRTHMHCTQQHTL